jgi:hypothetical protein
MRKNAYIFGEIYIYIYRERERERERQTERQRERERKSLPTFTLRRLCGVSLIPND